MKRKIKGPQVVDLEIGYDTGELYYSLRTNDRIKHGD